VFPKPCSGRVHGVLSVSILQRWSGRATPTGSEHIRKERRESRIGQQTDRHPLAMRRASWSPAWQRTRTGAMSPWLVAGPRRCSRKARPVPGSAAGWGENKTPTRCLHTDGLQRPLAPCDAESLSASASGRPTSAGISASKTPQRRVVDPQQVIQRCRGCRLGSGNHSWVAKR